MRRSLVMIALWAVLGVVAMGAGIAAVSSAQQAVGQVAVEPLSEEQVERAVEVGDADDLPLPTVSGLPGASPTPTKRPATPSASRTSDDSSAVSSAETTTEPGDDNGGAYEPGDDNGGANEPESEDEPEDED